MGLLSSEESEGEGGSPLSTLAPSMSCLFTFLVLLFLDPPPPPCNVPSRSICSISPFGYHFDPLVSHLTVVVVLRSRGVALLALLAPSIKSRVLGRVHFATANPPRVVFVVGRPSANASMASSISADEAFCRPDRGRPAVV